MIVRKLVIAAFAVSATAAFAEGNKQKSTQAEGAQAPAVTAQASQQDAATVKHVQQALNDKGFDVGPVDGIAGARTQAALQKFQQAQGLGSSGTIDSQTIASLGVTGGGSSSAPSSFSPQGDLPAQASQPSMSGSATTPNASSAAPSDVNSTTSPQANPTSPSTSPMTNPATGLTTK